MDALATLDKVFLVLWAVMGLLYWINYRKTDNIVVSYLKVAALLGFVWAVITGFHWLAEVVPQDQRVKFWGDPPQGEGPRYPQLAYAFEAFGVVVLLMICWYARKKVGTVCALMLSTWDRGHWYVLPVLFVLMTIGLVLVAAAASPVLSPFIYTLF